MYVLYSMHMYTHSMYEHTCRQILFSLDPRKAHTFSFVHWQTPKKPEEQILFQRTDTVQTTAIFITPSFTTDFFPWKTKGKRATGFWNAFLSCAIYGGIQKGPAVYIAGKLRKLSTRGIFLICF